MSLIQVALILLLAAGGVGAFLLFQSWREKPSPDAVAWAHFIFAAGGVAILATLMGGDSDVKLPMILYGFAAAGGLFVFSYRFRDRFPPKLIMLAHGATASAGTIALILAILG
ncbi:MAG: hypothetical protein AAGJ87_08610 [Pseudomonadota bacterium]